jgi:hypothetical protein
MCYLSRMEKAVCISCHKPKAPYLCGICESSLCKSCVQFVEEGSFSFLSHVPAQLCHETYCGSCFDSHVEPARQEYLATMEKAQEILVFMKKQGKETRLIKRLADPIKISDCPDEQETILRMAFFAVQADYNAIVDVDVHHEKVKTGSYTTMKWHGSCVPAYVNVDKLEKDRSTWQNPN